MYNVITRTAAAIKKATFGFELEYNKDEHPAILDASLSWLQDNGEENDVIKEDITTPTTLIRQLRRQAFIADTWGYTCHDEGCDDPTAGSMHMHCRIDGVDNTVIPIDNLMPMLCFADHMTRTSSREFRAAVSYRTRADVANVGFNSCNHLNAVGVPYDTKRYFICHNTGVDTIENRLNEGATSYVPTLLMPVLMTLPKEFGLSAALFSDVGVDCDGDDTSFDASDITRVARSGTDHKALLRYAISSYGLVTGHLGSGSGGVLEGNSRAAIDALPVVILQAALSGASAIQIHEDIVLPLFAGTDVFKRMVDQLG